MHSINLSEPDSLVTLPPLCSLGADSPLYYIAYCLLYITAWVIVVVLLAAAYLRTIIRDCHGQFHSIENFAEEPHNTKSFPRLLRSG